MKIKKILKKMEKLGLKFLARQNHVGYKQANKIAIEWLIEKGHYDEDMKMGSFCPVVFNFHPE